MGRLLVVDDSPTQAEALRGALELAGHEVHVAHDGEAALEVLARTPIDVVVTDVLMPGMSGYDLCRRIKDDQHLREVAVVLLTALSEATDIVRGLESGADNFLTKPCDPERVVERVAHILAGRRANGPSNLKVNVELGFLGHKIRLGTDQEQILGLLLSTFEETVRANRLLAAKQEELVAANARIARFAAQQEQRAEASEERYRALFEQAHDAIVLGDEHCVVREVNRAAEELFGRPGSELIGTTLVEHQPPEDRQAAEERLGHAARDGHVEGQVRFVRPDHSIIHAEVTAFMVALEGERLVHCMLRDVTAARRLQEQLLVSDRMASIGILAAGVGHEINNPVGIITANAEFVQAELGAVSGALGADEHSTRTRLAALRAPIADVIEASKRVREIVHDLRSFARTEESVQPVDVVQVLESSLRMAWGELRYRGRVIREFAEVPRTRASPGRLGQVLLNLIVNAAQALPEGRGADNEIRLVTRTDASGRVVIEVRDTGIGIAPEDLPKIFDPFFTTKPVGVGTGLGLAISKSLVTEMGGALEVDSHLGRGTVFRVVLPPAPPQDPVAAPAPAAPHGAAAEGAVRSPHARVLVVDDEAAIAAAVARVLQQEHEISTETCARQAIARLIAGERFDLVLCDLAMPEMSGMELLAEIERLDPAQARRVAFMTAGAISPGGREFLDGTGAEWLEKPFDRASLRGFVDRHLRAHADRSASSL